MTTKTICVTEQWLRKHGACSDGREWVISHYPDGVDILELVDALYGVQRDWAAWLVNRWPSAPVALVEKLASHSDWQVRRTIAERPRLSVALIEKLASDEDRNVRRVIARRPRLSVALIEKLAGDEDCCVRYVIAERKVMLA